MPKGNFVFVDGKGNLSRMFYGYTQKTRRILDEVQKKFHEYVDWEFENQKPVDGIFLSPPMTKWQSLHDFTKAIKKRDLVLIDKRDLWNSFKSERISDTFLWIGSNSPVAIIHEWGMTIKVTDKMRGYLASQGFHLKKSTKVITIPARPMFGPVYWKLWKEFKSVLEKENKQLDFAPVKVR